MALELGHDRSGELCPLWKALEKLHYVESPLEKVQVKLSSALFRAVIAAKAVESGELRVGRAGSDT